MVKLFITFLLHFFLYTFRFLLTMNLQTQVDKEEHEKQLPAKKEEKVEDLKLKSTTQVLVSPKS